MFELNTKAKAQKTQRPRTEHQSRTIKNMTTKRKTTNYEQGLESNVPRLGNGFVVAQWNLKKMNHALHFAHITLRTRIKRKKKKLNDGAKCKTKEATKKKSKP